MVIFHPPFGILGRFSPLIWVLASKSTRKTSKFTKKWKGKIFHPPKNFLKIFLVENFPPPHSTTCLSMYGLWAWWPKKFRENKGYSLWGWLTESEYKVVWGPGPSHEQHVLAPEQLPWAVKQFERSEFRQFHEFFQNLFDNSLVLQSFMKFFHKKSALLDNFFTRICSKLRRLIGRFIWHRQFCLQPIFSSKWRVAVKFVSSSLALMNQQLFQYRLLLC